MEQIKVYISEKKVPEAVSPAIANALAALHGGMQEVLDGVSADLDRNASRYHEVAWAARDKIRILKDVALGAVASTILADVAAVEKRIGRLEGQASFADHGSATLLSCHAKNLNGYARVLRQDEGVIVQLSLSDKDCKGLGVEKDFAVKESFDAACDYVMENDEAIRAEIEAMIAAQPGSAEDQSC